MKKREPLILRIPSPCSQDWNGMPVKEGGRYCGRCTQVVHDFSQMPDKELLQYFTTNPATACGRFHTHQLDRVIQPQKQRWNLPASVRKFVAAFFAGLSFRTAIAQGIIRSKVSVVMQPAAATEKNSTPESIIISGKVTKGNAEPVANAKVSIDTLINVYTDANGKFSIPLSGDLVTSHNLYFSYEGLERTVRTFHPLMGSANYDVRLAGKEDYNYRYIAGGISFNTIELPSIRFPDQQRFLSKDAKAILTFTSTKLKDNPTVMIKIVAYADRSNKVKIAKRKLRLVRDYLINDLSINKERIFETIEKAGADDIIDLLQRFQD